MDREVIYLVLNHLDASIYVQYVEYVLKTIYCSIVWVWGNTMENFIVKIDTNATSLAKKKKLEMMVSSIVTLATLPYQWNVYKHSIENGRRRKNWMKSRRKRMIDWSTWILKNIFVDNNMFIYLSPFLFIFLLIRGNRLLNFFNIFLFLGFFFLLFFQLFLLASNSF